MYGIADRRHPGRANTTAFRRRQTDIALPSGNPTVDDTIATTFGPLEHYQAAAANDNSCSPSEAFSGGSDSSAGSDCSGGGSD